MLGLMEPVMSDRTKLTIVSLVVIMLPYRLEFPIALLVVTAGVSTAIDIVIESWAQRQHLSRNFMAAISLYRRLKYHPS
jgi:Na+-translocating ferredoxin:NAD+ oxidoreductase RnfE subunit